MKNPPRRYTAVAIAVSLAVGGSLVTAPIAQAVTSAGAVTKSAAKTKITSQPKSVTVVPGKTAKLSVKASGQSLKYQWYSKKSGAKNWQKVSGKAAKKATYTVKATSKLNKTQYRVIVTGKQGKVTSKTATLTVSAKTRITTQPKSVSVVSGKTAKFTVKASGQSLKYQWYSKKSGAKNWQKVSGSAAKKATYSVKATTKLDKTQYRVVVTGKQGKATSKAATLSLIAKPKITEQPKLASGDSGERVSFGVKASGSELTYQWQVDNGSGWKNIAGATKATYGFTAKSALELNTYRVIVRNPAGSVTSEAAFLSVISTVSDPMETDQVFWLWSWFGVLFDTWQEDDEYDSTYQDLWGKLSITNISDYTLDAYNYLEIYYLGNDGEFYGDGGYDVTGGIWDTVPLAPGQSDTFNVYANVPDDAVKGGVWVFYDDTGEIIQYVEGF